MRWRRGRMRFSPAFSMTSYMAANQRWRGRGTAAGIVPLLPDEADEADAAVDDDGLADDHRRVRPAKEGDEVGDILRREGAAGGRVGAQRLADIGRQRGDAARIFDPAPADGGDAEALR